MANQLIAKNEIIKLLIIDRNISNKTKDRDASPKVNMNRETHVQKISNLNVTASGVEKKVIIIYRMKTMMVNLLTQTRNIRRRKYMKTFR